MNILMIVFMWVATGLFICYKQNWFKDTIDAEGLCTWVILTLPIQLIMSFIKVYLLGDWDAARNGNQFSNDFDDDEND